MPLLGVQEQLPTVAPAVMVVTVALLILPVRGREVPAVTVAQVVRAPPALPPKTMAGTGRVEARAAKGVPAVTGATQVPEEPAQGSPAMAVLAVLAATAVPVRLGRKA